MADYTFINIVTTTMKITSRLFLLIIPCLLKRLLHHLPTYHVESFESLKNTVIPTLLPTVMATYTNMAIGTSMTMIRPLLTSQIRPKIKLYPPGFTTIVTQQSSSQIWTSPGMVSSSKHRTNGYSAREKEPQQNSSNFSTSMPSHVTWLNNLLFSKGTGNSRTFYTFDQSSNSRRLLPTTFPLMVFPPLLHLRLCNLMLP